MVIVRAAPQIRRAVPGILALVVAEERVIKLGREGRSAPEIADELGVGLRTVQRILASAGLSAPRGRPTVPERERLQIRVDDDVVEMLDERASEIDSSRDRVAAELLTAWAQRRRNRKVTAP